MKYALAYVITALAFGGLDAIWLGTMANRFYRPRIGELMADKVALAPAAIFYALYIAGIVYFAVRPALAGTWRDAIAPAAMLGLVAYATYDLTNQATLRVWATEISIADIAWGVFATTAAAVAGAIGTGLLRPAVA